jgi:hypothetical protein
VTEAATAPPVGVRASPACLPRRRDGRLFKWRLTMREYGAALAFLLVSSLSAQASDAAHILAPLQTAPAQTVLAHAAAEHTDSGHTAPPQAAPAQTDPAQNDTLIFGMTAQQLAVGVVIGAGIGAIVVAASGNTLAGAGLGTLAAIYVAHLAVEAVVVGGVFYLWPSENEPSDAPSRKTSIRGLTASMVPTLPPQLHHAAERCQFC